MRKKTILCVDTGIDDALAIAYALASPELDLIGICVSYGMAPVPNTYSNTKKLVNLLGKDINVYMGTSAPLERERKYSGNFHGLNGLANLEVEDFSSEGTLEESITFINESIRKYGKDLQIITTGPLTDIAKVVMTFPESTSLLGKLICMAGAAITPGNSNLYAEANVFIDPEAAKICFESDMNITMVGLDVTRKTLLTQKELDLWKSFNTPQSNLFYEIVSFYLGAYKKYHPYLAGCALHDPLAVGVGINPNFIKTIPMNITVITEGEATGKTLENISKIDKSPNTNIALEVNSGAFMNDFYSKVNSILKKVN